MWPPGCFVRSWWKWAFLQAIKHPMNNLYNLYKQDFQFLENSGVVNMVFGYGSTVGEAIVTHPKVWPQKSSPLLSYLTATKCCCHQWHLQCTKNPPSSPSSASPKLAQTRPRVNGRSNHHPGAHRLVHGLDRGRAEDRRPDCSCHEEGLHSNNISVNILTMHHNHCFLSLKNIVYRYLWS